MNRGCTGNNPTLIQVIDFEQKEAKRTKTEFRKKIQAGPLLQPQGIILHSVPRPSYYHYYHQRIWFSASGKRATERSGKDCSALGFSRDLPTVPSTFALFASFCSKLISSSACPVPAHAFMTHPSFNRRSLNGNPHPDISLLHQGIGARGTSDSILTFESCPRFDRRAGE